MNIPELKVLPGQREFISPNPSYFKYKMRVFRPTNQTDDKTGSPDILNYDEEYNTVCHFEYNSFRNNDDQEIIGTEYQAQALVRIKSGMRDVDEGWTCQVTDPAGSVEWGIVGVDWPFGFKNRFAIFRLRKTTDATQRDV